MTFRPLSYRQTLFVILLIGLAAVLIAREVQQRRPEPPVATAPSGSAENPSQCQRRFMAREGVVARALSPLETPRGCGYKEGLTIREVAGVRFTRSITLDCDLATSFSTWVERDLKPLTERTLGSELVALEHIGGYNCRTIAGRSRLSEHSFGNAIDLAAIRLADGQRLKLLGNWSASEDSSDAKATQASFWRQAARKACRRFNVVLTPAYNAAHADHFHFDNGPFRSCRL